MLQVAFSHKIVKDYISCSLQYYFIAMLVLKVLRAFYQRCNLTHDDTLNALMIRNMDTLNTMCMLVYI